MADVIKKEPEMAQKPSKVNEMCLEFKAFYNKHFPTDRKTYNVRVACIGLIFSVCFVHFITNYFCIKYYFRYENNYILKYLYVFLAACLSYSLYYGLNIGDRKQYTPWILLKTFEVIFTFATIIYIIADQANYLGRHVGEIIYGIIILALNILVVYPLIKSSLRQFRGHKPNNVNTENVQDNYENVNFA